jgi:hypothetical protein
MNHVDDYALRECEEPVETDFVRGKGNAWSSLPFCYIFLIFLDPPQQQCAKYGKLKMITLGLLAWLGQASFFYHGSATWEINALDAPAIFAILGFPIFASLQIMQRDQAGDRNIALFSSWSLYFFVDRSLLPQWISFQNSGLLSYEEQMGIVILCDFMAIFSMVMHLRSPSIGLSIQEFRFEYLAGMLGFLLGGVFCKFSCSFNEESMLSGVPMSGCCLLHLLASVGFVFMFLWFDEVAHATAAPNQKAKAT